ncbi:MAG: hypothetical protein FIB08_00670 [Candidatus Methanoperedens sp.]|nr:hypothetical protein [Candidatus Methanoperedens sp.]
MKQQDAYKILAIFLIFTMVFSIFAYMFSGPLNDTTQEENPETPQEKYDPALWNVHQDYPFDSINDALNLTPVGAEAASYADLERMSPQMVQWTKTELPVAEVDSLYNSNTTRIYYSRIRENSNESFLLLSTMYPEKNDFQYIVYPNTGILRRMDTNAINILGTPVIYAPDDRMANGVVDIINAAASMNKTNTSYDRFAGLLDKIDPAPFQMINSNVSYAKQFYMGIREINGSYERTTAYLNLNSSTMKKLDQLKTNGSQNGFAQYNITKNENYTIVRVVTPDLLKLLTEEIS